jgi:hypothetical protein
MAKAAVKTSRGASATKAAATKRKE